MTTISPTDERAIRHVTFSGIIDRLMLPGGDDLFLDDYWEVVRALDPSDLLNISEIIIELTELLQSQSEYAPTTTIAPLLYFFLAHCYNLGFYTGQPDSQNYAIDCALRAIKGFKTKLNKFNDELNDHDQALAYWYLGLVYYNGNDSGSCLAYLSEADRLLIALQKEYEYRGPIEKYKEIQKLREGVMSWIKHASINKAHFVEASNSETQKQPVGSKDKTGPAIPRNPALRFGLSLLGRKPDQFSERPSAIDSTPFVRKELTISGFDSDLKLKHQEVSSGKQRSEPLDETAQPANNDCSRRFIIIPVDLQALQDPSLTLSPLQPRFFGQLRSFNERVNNNSSAPKVDPLERPETAPTQINLIIPSFPLYGQVTAGPSGAPSLNYSGWDAKAVSETLCINFDGYDHKVFFVNDVQTTFVDGKHYGWLKVKGESMNDAARQPINDNDYVLFCKNHDLEACAGKIVIASLPDLETQPPQLVLKRLVKMSGKVPSRRDGYQSEVIRFILRSESLLDSDPFTGMSFRRDIEIVRDGQIEGEVIAVARPVEKNPIPRSGKPG